MPNDNPSTSPYSPLREITVTVISLAIVVLSLWMLYDVYVSAGNGMADKSAELAAYGRKKDILLLALGLLGTVTGYYLGRVPAERTADAANARAADAKKVADNTKKTALSALDQVSAHLQPPGAAMAAPAPETLRDIVETARENIQQL